MAEIRALLMPHKAQKAQALLMPHDYSRDFSRLYVGKHGLTAIDEDGRRRWPSIALCEAEKPKLARASEELAGLAAIEACCSKGSSAGFLKKGYVDLVDRVVARLGSAIKNRPSSGRLWGLLNQQISIESGRLGIICESLSGMDRGFISIFAFDVLRFFSDAELAFRNGSIVARSGQHVLLPEESRICEAGGFDCKAFVSDVDEIKHMISITAGRKKAADGDCRGALRLFLAAREAVPDRAEAYSEIGLVLLNLGKPKEAIHYYKKAIELAGKDAELDLQHYNLAIARTKTGDTAQYRLALHDCTRAIWLNNKNEEAHLLRSWLHEQLGNTKESEADYEASMLIARRNGNRGGHEAELA